MIDALVILKNRFDAELSDLWDKMLDKKKDWGNYYNLRQAYFGPKKGHLPVLLKYIPEDHPEKENFIFRAGELKEHMETQFSKLYRNVEKSWAAS